MYVTIFNLQMDHLAISKNNYFNTRDTNRFCKKEYVLWYIQKYVMLPPLLFLLNSIKNWQDCTWEHFLIGLIHGILDLMIMRMKIKCYRKSWLFGLQEQEPSYDPYKDSHSMTIMNRSRWRHHNRWWKIWMISQGLSATYESDKLN